MQEFMTPSEWLLHVQNKLRAAVPASDPNIEFQEMYEEKLRALKQQGTPPPPLPDGMTSHEFIVNNLWDEIKGALPRECSDWCVEYLAIGLLENMHVNASCIRSQGNYFAIVIHSGLLTLFNKVSKILTAISDPKAILYCNRPIDDSVTAQVLMNWYRGCPR